MPLNDETLLVLSTTQNSLANHAANVNAHHERLNNVEEAVANAVVIDDLVAVETLTAKIDAISATVNQIDANNPAPSGGGSSGPTLSTIDGKVDTITTNLSTTDGKVDTITTNLSTTDGKVDTVDSNVDALIVTLNSVVTTLSTINSNVTNINNNTSGGGGGGAKFVSAGKSPNNPSSGSGKTWVAYGRTLGKTSQQVTTPGYGAMGGDAISINTGGGWVDRPNPSGAGIHSTAWMYTLEFDNYQ
jgi:hypothetical protein